MKTKQIAGWIIIALGVTLLVATVMSSPSALGWGNIPGPLPHFFTALLVLGGVAMVQDDRKKVPSKSSIAASWIGVVLGGFLLLMCGMASLSLLFLIVTSMASAGSDTTHSIYELPGLVVIVIIAFIAFLISRISYRILKVSSADKASAKPRDKRGPQQL